MTPLEAFSRTSVEAVSSGLLLGRQFRMFREFSITSGSSEVLRFLSTSDFALTQQLSGA